MCSMDHYRMVGHKVMGNVHPTQLHLLLYNSFKQALEGLDLNPKPDVQPCVNALTYLFRYKWWQQAGQN